MKSTFVRGIWGDMQGQYPTQTLEKIWRDIYETKNNYRLPAPCINHAFGLANHRLLKDLGIESRMMSKAGILNWTNSKEPRHKGRDKEGRINWGLSMWRHKLECIRRVLRRFDECVWLDWDCHLMADLPSDFWDRLRAGQPLQCQLRQYHVAQARWRSDEKRKVPHGAFIYCRSLELIERAIVIHEQEFPRTTDEVAFAYLIDELMGGWKGEEAYYAAGFAPYCYAVRSQCRMPEQILFVEGSEELEQMSTRVDIPKVA